MADKIVYRCSTQDCGYESSKWLGQCPNCKQWSSLKETTVSNVTVSSKKISQLASFVINGEEDAQQIKDVDCTKTNRVLTGINEFDRVFGNGLVVDSISILSAVPGAGKSTLCLMVCDKMVEKGYNVLYLSGEESKTQISNRAKRLNLKHSNEIWISNNTNLDSRLQFIYDKKINFIIVDSIQKVYANDALPSTPGSPSQIKLCGKMLMELAKDKDFPRIIILIGQMTKGDELSGPRDLEHLVDTYVQIECEEDDTLRTLRAIKNRFGNTGEMGFFSMEENGLVSIDNPSEYFMTERDAPAIGTAITVLKEGSRPIIAEIESLVSRSYTPYPSRLGEALRRDQLNILVSILEQRGKINLYDKNVIIKTTGGIKLKEPSANLATLMAIASSFKGKEIPNDVVFIADVGLTGELKKVPALETRIKELNRMDFKKVFIAPKALKNKKFNNIEVIECKTLSDVIAKCF